MDYAPNAMREDWQRRVWQPVLCNPPLCTLSELNDGTYSIDDLADMCEIINLRRAYENAADKKGGR